MTLAGMTAVGEFHYLHHDKEGRRYADPNAMGTALIEAAREAGIRITLLDACYLSGGLDATGHQPLDAVQQRFSDGSIAAWAERVAALRDSTTARLGSALHSVRAVPEPALESLNHLVRPRPLHVHLSEQPAENQAVQAFYGCTPAELLARHDLLGPETTVVHATHLTGTDVTLLGESRTAACFCPTTERDLADGIGPARALAQAGSPLCLGSDQHAVIDMFSEIRGLEGHERLLSHERGRFTPGSWSPPRAPRVTAASAGMVARSSREPWPTSSSWPPTRSVPSAAAPTRSSSPAPRPTSGGSWWAGKSWWTTVSTDWVRSDRCWRRRWPGWRIRRDQHPDHWDR